MSDNNTNKQSFSAGVQQEFGKISWPDSNKIIKQTIAVVSTSVVVGILIALIDFAAQYGVELLGK